MQTNTTRRGLLKAAPAATALVALPSAAVASVAIGPTAEAEDIYTTEDMRRQYESGTEVAYLWMARAWVDRWQALGGDFGFIYKRDGSPDRLIRGMVVDTDLWKRPDADRDDIPPHIKLTQDADHSGAVRALEGLLELCPGLKDAVKEIGGREAFQRWATGREA